MSRNDQSGEPGFAAGENVLVEGRVTEVDRTPMMVDGDGLLFVRSDRYGDVVVHIPARENLCRARGFPASHSASAGDSIRALGRVTGARDVTVCAEESHFLEKVD